jgi:hypothetical protein
MPIAEKILKNYKEKENCMMGTYAMLKRNHGSTNEVRLAMS